MLFVLFTVHGQDFRPLLEDLAFYGDATMNAAHSGHRMRANDSLNIKVDQFLNIPTSFSISLEEVPWISEQKLDGTPFRVITWQLNVGDSIFTYEGRIQYEDDSFVRLVDDKSGREPDYTTYSSDQWYGSRYYKMKAFDYKGKSAYLLFGFNAHSRWNRQKVVDVLFFEDNQPKFGLPVFVEEGKNPDRYGNYRLILTYSLDSRVHIDFDEEKNMIVHDHLMPIQGRFEGQGDTAVGDGSFVGYWPRSDGLWIYKDKLFEDNQELPETGIQKSNDPKKDIFGRSRQ